MSHVCLGRRNVTLVVCAVSSNVSSLKRRWTSLCNICFLFWNETPSDMSLCCKCSGVFFVCFLLTVFCLLEWWWLRLTCCGLKTGMREWSKTWIYLYCVLERLFFVCFLVFMWDRPDRIIYACETSFLWFPLRYFSDLCFLCPSFSVALITVPLILSLEFYFPIHP